MDKKICIFCKHFGFLPSDPGPSNETPGWDASAKCYKGHWQVFSGGCNTLGPADNIETYHECLLKAKTCKDYEECD